MVSGASISTEEVAAELVKDCVAVITVIVLSELLLPGVDGLMVIVVLEMMMTELLGVVEREVELVLGDARVGPNDGLREDVVVRLELALDELVLARLLDGVEEVVREERAIEEGVAEKVEAVPLLVNVVVVTSTPVVIVYDDEELVLLGAHDGQHGSTYVYGTEVEKTPV